MEFFEYAIDLAMLDHWGGILIDIHGRIKRWMIYNAGNLVYSKICLLYTSGEMKLAPVRVAEDKYPTSVISIPKEHKTGAFYLSLIHICDAAGSKQVQGTL